MPDAAQLIFLPVPRKDYFISSIFSRVTNKRRFTLVLKERHDDQYVISSIKLHAYFSRREKKEEHPPSVHLLYLRCTTYWGTKERDVFCPVERFY